MEIQSVLKVLLLIVLLYPFLDVGGRWLHRWVQHKLELWDMMDTTCNSLNKVTGLCEWGSECHCFREYMEKHADSDGHIDMYQCYPKNTTTNLAPITAPKGMKELVEDAAKYGTGWVEKPNPGLVEEGTQPVEAEEDQFPGFSKFGG